MSDPYEFIACVNCGERFQSIDFHGAAHRLWCSNPEMPSANVIDGKFRLGTPAARHIDLSAFSEEVPPVPLAATPGEAFQGHHRPWVAVLVLLSSLFYSGVVQAAEPAAQKAPRVKPVSAITIKVMPPEKLGKAEWKITTADADSCTAWVSSTAKDVTATELVAFKACRAAINKAVDGAAEKAGV